MNTAATLDLNLIAQLHAAHAPDSTSADKADAAAAVNAALSASISLAATSALNNASAALSATAGMSNDATATNALTGIASFMASVALSITLGADPATALMDTPTPAAPSAEPGEATDALTRLLGALTVQGSAQAEAAIPLLDGLITLSGRADQGGLDWGAHVVLPFTNGVTFAGGLTQDRTGARRAELAFGYAARLQGGSTP